jgi:hypothetical protein
MMIIALGIAVLLAVVFASAKLDAFGRLPVSKCIAQDAAHPTAQVEPGKWPGALEDVEVDMPELGACAQGVVRP